jgi:iron-sulfur cluster assembly protein
LEQYHKLGIFALKSFLFKINLNSGAFILKDKVMITVTDSAREQAIHLMEEDGKPNLFIRVGVEGGGCSGLTYQLAFDNIEKEGDKSFEDNGVKVVVDKKSYLYLIGTSLDFSGGLNGKGFVFNNPNAGRTCGCGESFSI